jgi:hypothetical protein
LNGFPANSALIDRGINSLSAKKLKNKEKNKMTNKFMQTIIGTFLALVMLIGATQIFVAGQDSENSGVLLGQDERFGRTIEGVWRARITPRNCVTGVPNPTAAFEALFTFHKGGTISAWTQNSVITVTRSPSHGLWKRESGWSNYSFKFVHFRYNLTTGEFAASQEASGTLVLGASGDQFTTDASSRSFDVNGNQIGSGSCSNSVGTRFKLEQ